MGLVRDETLVAKKKALYKSRTHQLSTRVVASWLDGRLFRNVLVLFGVSWTPESDNPRAAFCLLASSCGI